jgi:hypothetical protein
MAWFDSFGVMQENYQLLKEYNAIYFFDEGRYNAGSLTAFDNLKVYLNSKLMWDVNADIAQLTQNFFDNFFKDASQPMMEYYQSYRDRSNYIINTLGVDGYIYGEITTEQYPKALLESWLQKIDEAYAAIESLKSTDKDLYDLVEARITQESMAIRFHLIQLYATSYDAETLMDMKLSFKEDVTRLGFVYNTEWSTFEDTIYPEWSVKTIAKHILRDQDEEMVADIVGSGLADYVPEIKEYNGYSYT